MPFSVKKRRVKKISDPRKKILENFVKLTKWPKINDHNISEVLRAGFTYEGHDDVLKCVACGVKLFDWQPGDEPVKAHKDFYPECEYIQDVEEKKPIMEGPPTHGHMSTFKSRLDTYRSWPPASKVSMYTLADAGFFYSGVRDNVTCYYCDVHLEDWKSGDIPHIRHGVTIPNCPTLFAVEVD